MRTIKFRAFNIKENKMIDWEALIGYCDIDYLFGGGYLRVNKRHSNFIYPIAMQFTGLHDKNGVEIFEGDVIHSDTHNENFVINFNDGCFSYESMDKSSYNYLYELTLSNIKVIGNVHEK